MVREDVGQPVDHPQRAVPDLPRLVPGAVGPGLVVEGGGGEHVLGLVRGGRDVGDVAGQVDQQVLQHVHFE